LSCPILLRFSDFPFLLWTVEPVNPVAFPPPKLQARFEGTFTPISRHPTLFSEFLPFSRKRLFLPVPFFFVDRGYTAGLMHAPCSVGQFISWLHSLGRLALLLAVFSACEYFLRIYLSSPVLSFFLFRSWHSKKLRFVLNITGKIRHLEIFSSALSVVVNFHPVEDKQGASLLFSRSFLASWPSSSAHACGHLFFFLKVLRPEEIPFLFPPFAGLRRALTFPSYFGFFLGVRI